MTAGPPPGAVAVADPAEPEHAWTRSFIGWRVAFWLFMALSVLALSTDTDLSPTRRNLGFAVIAVLSLAYAGFRPEPTHALKPANLSYLLVAIVCSGVACAVDPMLSMVLFIVYPQVWMFCGATRSGVVLNFVLTGSVAIGFLTEAGWSVEAALDVLPSMLVSLLFSLLLGIWISRIIDQSQDRAELIAQLEATRSQLGEAHHAQGVMAERERMAREIHDTLAQGFTSIIMLAQAARAEMEAQSGTLPACARLDSIELVARENLEEARALVAAFSPVDLAGSTLADAVSRLAERFGTETGVAIDVEMSARSGSLSELSRDQEVVLLRAAQEALTNVRRHARARLVTVRLTAEGAEALVEVEDDGVGFGPDTPTGFGLTGMRDRARDAGGELDVASAPGRGTRVSVRVPVAAGSMPAGPVPAGSMPACPAAP
jgi:signal transduction histidine kinase